MRPGPRNAWDTPSGRLARKSPAAARAKSRAVQDSHARCADASAGDDALDYLGGIGGGYFGYAEAFAGVDDGSDAGDGLDPSASGYASEDVLDGEGQYANDRGGYSDHEFDDRELDLEARVSAAEAEAEAMAGEEEVAEAAVAQLRGHSRQHAATILSSNPYFEQVGEDEGRPVQEDAHPDGKLERLYRSGRCEVLYATGTRKEVMPSGLHTVFFCNGDVKQTAPSRRVVYYHAEADTTHVSEPDGTQIYHFPNQQVERHFTDGLKEISFPDGMVKVILPNGDVQTIPTITSRGALERRRGLPYRDAVILPRLERRGCKSPLRRKGGSSFCDGSRPFGCVPLASSKPGLRAHALSAGGLKSVPDSQLTSTEREHCGRPTKVTRHVALREMRSGNELGGAARTLLACFSSLVQQVQVSKGVCTIRAAARASGDDEEIGAVRAITDLS
eukprot:scaffold16447_cov116-Isochrysis_galbana.AAC.7